MTCWAYYPGPGEEGVPEEFLRHSIGVAEYMFNDLARITTPVIRKASRMLGVSEDLVSDAVLLGGLLHDLGKTCVCYQEKPWEGFSGHWLLSAGVVYNIITNPLLKAPVNELTHLLVLPILLHHYAKTDVLKNMNQAPTRIQVHSDCIEAIRALVDYGLPRARSPIGRTILNSLLTDLGDGVLNTFPVQGQFKNELTNKLYNPRSPALMAIAGLLNEADGTVAVRNRNRSRGW